LEVGTLGGCVYSSIHGHTVEDALENFVGDFSVGNVLMTMNSPDYLTMKEEDSLELVKQLAKPNLWITGQSTSLLMKRKGKSRAF